MIAVAVRGLFDLVSVYVRWHIMNPTAKQGDLLAHSRFNDLECERIGDELVMQKRHFHWVTNLTRSALSNCIGISTLRFRNDIKQHSIFKDHGPYFS